MILKEFIPRKKDLKEQFYKNIMEFTIKIKIPLYVSLEDNKAIIYLAQNNDEIFYKDIKIKAKLLISNHKNILSKKNIKVELKPIETLADIGITEYKENRKVIPFKSLELNLKEIEDKIKIDLDEKKVLSQIFQISNDFQQEQLQQEYKQKLKIKFASLLKKDFDLKDIEENPIYREIYLTYIHTKSKQTTANLFNISIDEVNLIIFKIENISEFSFKIDNIHLDLQTINVINQELGVNVVEQIQNKFQNWKNKVF